VPDSDKKKPVKISVFRREVPEAIWEFDEVRVTKMNNILEVKHLAVEPSGFIKTRKLDKKRYVDLETGEILEYNLSKNRGDNIPGLKKTFRALRNLINNNFTGAANELFVTLTYKENMTDVRRLYKDFDVFMKRLKRKFADIDYLCIVEPQGRGAWHCHVLIRFNGVDKIYVSNNEIIAPMWGFGFTQTKCLENVDNIGAYLTTYLTDIEVCDKNQDSLLGAVHHQATAFETIVDDNGECMTVKVHARLPLNIVDREVTEGGQMVKKRFVKGARLHMYPPGMNLYRCSRGIKKPDTEKMDYGDVKKIVGSSTPDYASTIDLFNDKRLLNTITYEQYNLKRGNVNGN